MPLNQFSSMFSLLPQVEAVMREKGESLPRPDYSGCEKAEVAGQSPDSDVDSGKRNFEETSEEEE